MSLCRARGRMLPLKRETPNCARPIASDGGDGLAALDADQRKPPPHRRAYSPPARTSSSFAKARDPCGAWQSWACALLRGAARAEGRCRACLAAGRRSNRTPSSLRAGRPSSDLRLTDSFYPSKHLKGDTRPTAPSVRSAVRHLGHDPQNWPPFTKRSCEKRRR